MDHDEVEKKADSAKEESKKSSKKKRSLPTKNIIIAAILVVALATAGVMTFKYQDLKKNPEQVTQSQQKKLLEKVGALIKIPSDEQPSIATVSDKEKLKEQAFFKNAENGDTLLIYSNAKKAILYRESSNQVIEVAPIAIDVPQQGTTASEPEATKPQ